jgi:hypothetical protein
MFKIDNTRRESIVECPRKTYLSFYKRLTSVNGSTALRYGSVWHEVQDSYYSFVRENGWKDHGRGMQLGILAGKLEWDHYTNSGENGLRFFDDYRNLENLMKSFLGYLDRYNYDQGSMEIIESETPFEVSMVPTELELRRYPYLSAFLFTGIIDLEVVLNGMPWIVDHKTTGQPLSSQVKRTKRDPQFLGYTFAAKHWLEMPPEGALINFHFLSARKSSKTGQYGEPSIDYQRSPQIYSDVDFENWKESLYYSANRWQECVAKDNWPMEFSSCYHYGECKYTQLCEQQRPLDNLILEGFYVTEPWDVAEVHNKRIARRQVALDALAGSRAASPKGVGIGE